MAKPLRNVREPAPPKGWHWEFELDHTYYTYARRHEIPKGREREARAHWVRDGFHLERCTGDAHSNAFIDNCGQCMPLWGTVAVPNEKPE